MTADDAIEQVALAIRSGIELFHRLVNPYIMKREADARLYAAKRDAEIEQLKFQNYDSTMRKMPGLLHEGSEIHDNLNMTWFLNFHDIVERISDDDIQNIFAAIMAGELESPGRCSIRTMRVIADLSRDEARLFRKASGCITRLDDRWIIPVPEFNEKIIPLSYEDLLLLEDCGLLHVSGGLFYNREFDGQYTQMNYQNRLLGVISPDENGGSMMIKVGSISKLTKAGEELYDILTRYGMIENNDEFFIKYVKRLAEIERKLHVQLFCPKRDERDNIVANEPSMIDMSVDDIKTLIENPAI